MISFENPAGLWLLLGIPVFILIWLIRLQHESRTVSSSYIWRLSDRFMKKRVPVTRLKKWLTFLLQLLLIAGAALLAAHPVWHSGELIDYVAILDASASMQAQMADGQTRWDEAVRQITELAGETAKGHRISILLAGEEPVWLLQEGTSSAEAEAVLNAAECGWGGADITGAMTLAQLFADAHANTEITLYTDQTVTEAEGLTVVSLNDGSWNAAVTGLSVTQTGTDSYTVTGTVTSCGWASRLNVGLKLNDRLKDTAAVTCESDVPQTVTFEVFGVSDLTTVELYMEPNDALSVDDRYVLCVPEETVCNTLLVTDTPLYLKNALLALDRGAADTVGTAGYTGQSGYDLYIFDGFVPSVLPTDGMVLLIDPVTLPEGLTPAGTSDSAALLLPATGIDPTQEKLLADLQLREITVASHQVVQYGAAWTSLLTCGGNSVLLTRDTGDLAVLLFDLHDSNLPMLTDFLTLLRNCQDLAVQPLLDTQDVTIGNSVMVTVPEDAAEAVITDPNGKNVTLTGSGAVSPVVPGVYEASAGARQVAFFAHISTEESSAQQLEDLTLTHPEHTESLQEATSGLWKLLAGLLLILLLIEWSMYTHEQS